MRLRKKADYCKTSCAEEGTLEIRFIDCYIGSGVFAVTDICKGKLIAFYDGEQITQEEGERRHNKYEQKDGSFLFFFKHKGKKLCIDATHGSGFGRMINDNHRKPNCKVVVEERDGDPVLCIYSLTPILRGEELFFDYQDSSTYWRKKNAPRYAIYPCPEPSVLTDVEDDEGLTTTTTVPQLQTINEEPLNIDTQEVISNTGHSKEPEPSVLRDVEDDEGLTTTTTVPQLQTINEEPLNIDTQEVISNTGHSKEPEPSVLRDVEDDEGLTTTTTIVPQLQTINEEPLNIDTQEVISNTGHSKEPEPSVLRDVEDDEGLTTTTTVPQLQTINEEPLNIDTQEVISNTGHSKEPEPSVLRDVEDDEGLTTTTTVPQLQTINEEPLNIDTQEVISDTGHSKEPEPSVLTDVEDDEGLTTTTTVPQFQTINEEPLNIDTQEVISDTGHSKEPEPSVLRDVEDDEGLTTTTTTVPQFQTINEEPLNIDTQEVISDTGHSKEPVKLFGSVSVMKDGQECDVFAMCSTILAVGSATSNDIIVKNAARHEVILQANRFGEVFIFHGSTNFLNGHYLNHNEIFTVGRRLFKWKYPLSKESTHECDITGVEGNNLNSIVRSLVHETNDEEEPSGHIRKEPSCEGNKRKYSHFVSSNELDASHTGVDKEPDDDMNIHTLSDIDDDFENDPDYCFKETGEQFVSDSDDESDYSDILPFVREFNDSNFCTGEEIIKKKKMGNDGCEIVTSTESCTRQNEMKETLSESLENIKLQPSRNTEGKRVWDKLHYCVFCEEKFTNLTKHFFGRHKNEGEVVKISNMEKNSKERKNALLKLRNAGDCKHNMEVLKDGKGTMITWSRKLGENSPTDYLPCEDCLAFFLKGSLWRHRKNCPLKKDGPSKRKVQSGASFLLPVSKMINEGLRENVLKNMSCDEVSIAVRNDSLILRVGEKLFQKHGHQEHLSSYIRQKMRELGRFLIYARKTDPGIQCLNDVLAPEKYSKVAIVATRALCKYDKKTNTYCNPSLALKLGHLLKKCARIKKSESLIADDAEQGKQADDFLTLIENEWTDEVSSCALQTLKENKINKGQVLPLTEDIKKLQVCLKEMTDRLIVSLQQNFSKLAFDNLNQVTLARLVLFNRRRGGETERVKLKAYGSKLNKSCSLKEVEECLSPVEKMLCATFSRLEIRGKKGRTVPVLLTPAFEKSIDLLIKYREDAGIHPENPYLFARSNYESKQSIRSTDVLRKYAKEAQLTTPENITSTKLRKHVATVTQLLNLSRNDMETMAEFMGHDIDVHKTFYRLPQETIQIVKMGRLLSAFDSGTIGQYRGKTLDEVPVDYDVEESSEEETDSEVDDENLQEDMTGNDSRTYVIKPSSSKSSCYTESQDIEASTSEGAGKRPKPLVGATKRPKPLKGATKIQRLSTEQTVLLKSLFKANVNCRRELRKSDCDKVIYQYDVLRPLSWQKIKNTVHNWIIQEKRKMKLL